MAATVDITESNGAGETPTDAITTAHYGVVDSANISSASFSPIPPSTNSFTKWHRARLHVIGGASQLDTWRARRTIGGSDGSANNVDPTNPGNFHKTINQASPGTVTYGTPSQTAIPSPAFGTGQNPINMPTTDAGVTTITGSLSTLDSRTGYFVHQVQLGATAVAGNPTGEITWSWREIA